MPTSQGVRESELATWLRLAAEQSKGEAFILMDPAGVIQWWSPAAEAIFSRPRAEVVGQHISTIFTPEDQRLGLDALERRIADSDATSEDDRWHLRADGSKFWSTGTMSAIRDASGELLGFCKILRDRTSLKEQLDHLSNELEAVKHAAEARTAGIATVTHELRNLVAAVFHGANMLRRAPDAERRDQLLDLLEQQAHSVYRLTDDMFDASRVSLGRLSLVRREVSLPDVITQVVSVLQSSASQKDLQLEFLSPGVAIMVDADATRLYQLFSNLIENAIKYTPAHGRIWVKLTVEDIEAVVHVEDTGIGIPSDMLTSIFDLFTQASTELTHKGLGVGLAVVREVVALHGGTVQANSAGAGRGSQFTVRLPLTADYSR